MKIEKKRYALLLAAEDSDYVKKMYGGYFNVFVEAFGEEGQQWDLFRAIEGQFPSMEELDEYHGFVVSGSPHDAFANDLWILKLCILLQELNFMKKKVLGICFGHQVLCRAFGGKIGRSSRGWDIGIRRVTLGSNLPPYKHFDSTIHENIGCASIIECHQDEVLEIPLGAEVIGYSDKTPVEMFCMGEHILGIQGHPEYTKDILYSLLDRLFCSEIIESDLVEDLKASIEKEEPDRYFWLKMCRSFLRGD